MKPFQSKHGAKAPVNAWLAADGAFFHTAGGGPVHIDLDQLEELAEWCAAARTELEPKLEFSAMDPEGCTLRGDPREGPPGVARLWGHDEERSDNSPVDLNAAQLRRLATWAIASAERLESES